MISFENVSMTQSYAAGTTIATLADSFRPVYSLSFWDPMNSLRITITYEGSISCNLAVSSGAKLRGVATYITNFYSS